uniref:Uncharacterized protein n=1 Tax=Proboscia inermis TaxID=420281 RepID=A0A7S0C2T1_9STRA
MYESLILNLLGYDFQRFNPFTASSTACADGNEQEHKQEHPIISQLRTVGDREHWMESEFKLVHCILLDSVCYTHSDLCLVDDLNPELIILAAHHLVSSKIGNNKMVDNVQNWKNQEKRSFEEIIQHSAVENETTSNKVEQFSDDTYICKVAEYMWQTRQYMEQFKLSPHQLDQQLHYTPRCAQTKITYPNLCDLLESLNDL